MESTGLPQKIQVSQELAEILFASGKGRWLVQRQDKVVAKGKGELTTYWLLYHTGSRTDAASSTEGASYDAPNNDQESVSSAGSLMEAIEEEEEEEDVLPQYAELSAKTSRLIDWNKDLLARLLRAIVARRQALNQDAPTFKPEENFSRNNGFTVLDEVQEIVALPAFDPNVNKREVDPGTIELGEQVDKELGAYIATVASMYRDNPCTLGRHQDRVLFSTLGYMFLTLLLVASFFLCLSP